MTLLLTIERGHSADGILVMNVHSYTEVAPNTYVVVVRNPKDNELYDYIIKHVAEIKEDR